MQDDARRRVDEDLVWYLNGSLDAEGRAVIADYAAEHAEAAARIRYWQAVRVAVKDTAPQRSADAGLEKFMQCVQSSSARRTAARGGIRAWLDGALRAFATPRLGLTAASLIIVVQAGIIAVMLGDRRAASLDSEVPAAVTRSLESPSPAPPFVKVRFKATATAREIDRLLLDIDASIVAGPLQGGYYAIRPHAASVTRTATRIAASQLVDDVIPVESNASAAPSR